MSERERLHTSDFADGRTDEASRREDERLTRDEPAAAPTAAGAAESAPAESEEAGGDRAQRAEQRERPSSSAAMAAEQDATAPLLAPDESERFDERWQQIQTSFVDEPRESVERADALVADLMQQLAGNFADTRARLESQWSSGGEASTEDLRIALTRYRSFFKRLLSA